MFKLPEFQSSSPEPRDPLTAKTLAVHAVLSRLIASLINEGLAQGVYNIAENRGVILPLDCDPSIAEINDKERITFPLHQAPSHTEPISGCDGSLIRLIFIDPEDIPLLTFLSYETVHPDGTCTSLENGAGVMNIIRSWNPAIHTPGFDAVMGELTDCLKNAVMVYLNPPPTPTLETGYNAWEQSLVDGHSTHPVRAAMVSLVIHTEKTLLLRCSYPASHTLRPLARSPSTN
jgi:hypothetical protein